MHQFFVKSNQIWQNSIRIEGKDVNHIRNVLRMQNGDQLMVTDENEVEYLCEIGRIDADAVWLKLLKKDTISRELPTELYLFQCLPKGDKMDFIVEKAVELGVHTVIPVESKRCVVKLDSKKAPVKVKRWAAVAEAAAKQSKRSKIPHIHQVIGFDEAIKLATQYNLACIPYEGQRGMEGLKNFVDKVKPGLRVAVIIGPEGGFEPEEINAAVNMGIKPVSLGNRILRTETAGIAMLSMLMLTLECSSVKNNSNNSDGGKSAEETVTKEEVNHVDVSAPVAEAVETPDVEAAPSVEEETPVSEESVEPVSSQDSELLTAAETPSQADSETEAASAEEARAATRANMGFFDSLIKRQ